VQSALRAQPRTQTVRVEKTFSAAETMQVYRTAVHTAPEESDPHSASVAQGVLH
jgi:hypothetical protein